MFMGSSSGPTLESSIPGTSPYGTVGDWGAGVGDVNGDGYDDFIISSWAETRLFLGSNGTLPTSVSDADATYYGVGYSPDGLSAIGDLNDDGYDDFCVLTDYSVIYIILGRSGSIPSTTNIRADADMYIKADPTYYGFNGDYGPGIGDFNGDGKDDFVIGSPDSGDPGRAHVMLQE